jgi:two-component system, LytTR family, response regulator AlgR
MNAGEPLRVLIADDERPARTRLADLLADCREAVPNELAGEAATGTETIARVAAAPIDLVLLDIRMPEMGGIEVARHLQELREPPAIVFTTAYESYAVDAFDVHAVDYLLKPIRAARLAAALARVRALRSPGATPAVASRARVAPFLSVHGRGRIHLVPVQEVIFLRAELKYVTVRTAEREYLMEDALARLEHDYPDCFVRVHRNCLVARHAVRGFERGGEGDAQWFVILRGCDERIPVSRRQAHIVRQFSERRTV